MRFHNFNSSVNDNVNVDLSTQHCFVVFDKNDDMSMIFILSLCIQDVLFILVLQQTLWSVLVQNYSNSTFSIRNFQ